MSYAISRRQEQFGKAWASKGKLGIWKELLGGSNWCFGISTCFHKYIYHNKNLWLYLFFSLIFFEKIGIEFHTSPVKEWMMLLNYKTHDNFYYFLFSIIS